jgi:hypothetical protein
MKKPTLRQLSAILAVSAISGCPAFAKADDGGKPAAAEFYPLLGHWTGSGKLIVGNDEPMDLTIDLNCGEAANGWAVHCDMIAKNPNMTIYESDLMGVDPITGMGHWYAITDQGDAHDHIVEWKDANDMSASYSWKQDGKQMAENVSMKFDGGNTIDFSSVITADGEKMTAFSGKMTK